MKKALLVTLLVLGLVLTQTSDAVMALNWKAIAGFWKSDGVTPLLPGPGNMYALVQLIFTPDTTRDPLDMLNPPYYTSGNDMYFTQYITDRSADDWGSFDGGVYVTNYMPGWVYIRVFDEGSHLGITNNMWYFESGLIAVSNLPAFPLQPPQIVDFSELSGWVGDVLDRQVFIIPEPATWAMMLLGATALVGRKLLRK